MKINTFFISLFFLLSAPTFAQKEAAIWYFGDYAGLDFNSGSPKPLINGQLSTHEGCTTISDKNGNLLFYTDGSIVYDKLHNVMPNGSGLLGHNSSTQSAIIVPKPNNPNIYYIFTVDEPNPKNADKDILNDVDPPNSGLNYSIVDLRLNKGLGDIPSSSKNIHLITYNDNDEEEVKFKCSEKVTAVQHGDGVSFWVITHFKNTFYSFKVGSSGVDKNPVKTVTTLNIPLGGYNYNAMGYLKVSPNGRKLAMANSSTRSTNELGPKNSVVRDTGNVLLFDFNSITGIVSNGIKLIENSNPYGLEFSAKSKKLYITSNKYNNTGQTLGSELLQFDLKSSNIIGSKTIINSSVNSAGALQLAIDEKIYRSGYPNTGMGGQTTKLSVINNPELDGASSNYLQDAIDLKGRYAELGLPPFITSFFLYSFSYEFNCLGDTTHFFINTTEKIDSVLWDFGDGTTSTDITAYHTYANPGDYTVTIIKSVNGELREPLEKNVTIYDTPKILSTPYKLIQCDTQDSQPTDGLSTFNLSLANEALCLGEKDFEVYYYHSINDAEADVTNTNSIRIIYKNSIPDEQLYAKIIRKNASCSSIGGVILHANKNNLIAPSPLRECDIDNGKAVFNLEQKKELIKTELNLPSDVHLFFYANENDASLGINELEQQYTSSSKIIFIRAENSEGCYGTGQLELIVEPIPKIKTLENKILCEGELSIVLTPGIIPPALINDFSYLWSTGETTSSISINKEGNYNVTVTNKSNCSSVENFEVTLSYLAKINDIIIKDLKPQNEVFVDVINPDEYKYMIQFQNGSATVLQDSPFFENIPGGVHELIIENNQGCGQVRKQIIVLQAPAFFTPNGDGYNDYWNIKGINAIIDQTTSIYIFDRYGKFLKQLSPSGSGWDGTFNKFPLPSDDYWYTVKLEGGRESKGHFSLKR